ncbi:MAG TPA: PspC domain-containing protein [Streptosporangiaceae bacterium]|jgi:phage shock protein PspC (stress-responsive transcriptional regulator)
MNTTTANQSPVNDQESTETGRQQLTRPLDDRMIAGVAAGIARYLDVDVTIVRIAIAVLTVIGGAGVPLYLAGWLLIPEEGSEQSIASQYVGSRQARSH